MLCGPGAKDLKLFRAVTISDKCIWTKSAFARIEVIFLLEGNVCVGNILEIVVVSGHRDNMFIQETFQMEIIVSLE
ncbi:hypothetical protein N7447_007214 [Penicillium robsamsonii]|uniref:uncharacterized protein n=1 Tax=Penicillium robsamsonii TaxID=1792511 RepID=UPI00254796D1|nr:uncharacterized protein N7447_007214 [Penicillium robsamsonii]KAJ5824874.1 hypothetical protein N7447_007214 [Penicillium robsamsonii]